MLDSDVALNGLDVFAAVLFFGLLCFETLADYQMMVFQTEKCTRARQRRARVRGGAAACEAWWWW